MPNEDDAVNAGGNGGVNVQSGSDMGFGGGVDLGNVNTGAAFDADRGGLGSGLGLTDDRGRDLGLQVSQGTGPATGPGFGTVSKTGSAIGTVLGLLTGIPGAGLLGAYGPGLVNSIMGTASTPTTAGTIWDSSSPSAAAGSIGAAGKGGGLLGIGGDTSNADALAQLYMMLKAQGVAA